MEQIIIVGGGAGGAELAVRLARRLRRDPGVEVVLIDREPTHIWKPLLHEVATGSLDSSHDETSYITLSKRHGFRFILGEVVALDTDRQIIEVESRFSDDPDDPPQNKRLRYAQLALAIGSVGNDFNTPGVREHALFLDNREQAEHLHRRFVNQLHRINNQLIDQGSGDGVESAAERALNERLSIVIVGGGATGVELAADLHNVVAKAEQYGFETVTESRLDVTLLEASPTLLGALPARISQRVMEELDDLGVNVRTNARVTEIKAHEVLTADGEQHPCAFVVWTAGIRAPGLLGRSGLQTDRIGRVLVASDLRVEGVDNLFALGDCCHCPMADGNPVPPRAQSAHQMATTASHNIMALREGRATRAYEYRDFGSLVNLSGYSTVGNLMGNLMRGSVFVEGLIARFMYRMLYRMHQRTIHGWFATVLIVLGDRIHRVTHSRVKLH